MPRGKAASVPVEDLGSTLPPEIVAKVRAKLDQDPTYSIVQLGKELGVSYHKVGWVRRKMGIKSIEPNAVAARKQTQAKKKKTRASNEHEERRMATDALAARLDATELNRLGSYKSAPTDAAEGFKSAIQEFADMSADHRLGTYAMAVAENTRLQALVDKMQRDIDHLSRAILGMSQGYDL